MSVYEARPVNGRRRRATKAEMGERAQFLCDYAEEHGPITVRGLYYQAEVHRVPGIEKDDPGYNKVQRQVLALRREGRMPYRAIADSTRWMRKPASFDSIEQALADTARFYRRSLWADSPDYVETWIEKDALAGVVLPVTELYDVPLMVARGFTSETFCFEAAEARRGDPRRYVVYYLGDLDRAGVDAERSLEEKLRRFCDDIGVEVVFERLAVNEEQVAEFGLPTRPPKRLSPADRKWPLSFACELDALPPGTIRALVERAIRRHVSETELRIVRTAESSERELLHAFARAPRTEAR